MTQQMILNKKIYTSDDLSITAVLETPEGVVPPMVIEVMSADAEAVRQGFMPETILLKSNWARLVDTIEDSNLPMEERIAAAKEFITDGGADGTRIISIDDDA